MYRFLLSWLILWAACALHAEDRDTAVALLSTAEKSFKANDLATAKSMCERALSADGTFAAAHLQMGQIQEALNEPREAIKCYTNAAELARKDNNTALASKATAAAKKLGPGLVEIAAADQRLVEKSFALGEKALAEEQLETAKAAFTAVLALEPHNAKARQKLALTDAAILARGDPVRARIAAAVLSEIYYHVGTDKKDEAVKLANDLTARFSDTPAGKEAGVLLANNFSLSKTAVKQQIETAKVELAERQKKLAAAKPAGSSVTKSTPRAPATAVDVNAVEKAATDAAQKLPREKLLPTFQQHLSQGKEFYAKAKPGTEDNQKNLGLALEQFINAEAVYLRLEEQKLDTPELQKEEELASMLRYACMKMTILSQ